MKAAVLYEPRTPMQIEEVSVDRPMAREVLVRVAGSGLCHSDLHFIDGDLTFSGPTVFGHEVAGVVEAVGPEVTTVRVGDPVVGCVSGFCGHCDPCVSGKTQQCLDRPMRRPDDPPRLTMNGKPVGQGISVGGFAEQVLLHENWWARVTPDIPLDRAALLGCSVVTGLGSVFGAARVPPASRVAVVGCGGVGLNVVQGARIAGARQIIAIDVSPEKLALARKFGATDCLLNGPDVADHVRELSHGGVEYSFEVIGREDTILLALQLLARGGLLTLVGVARIDATIPLPVHQMLINEWRIQGTRVGSIPFARDIPRFAQMYLAGQLDLDSLVSARIPLQAVNEGYDAMRKGHTARSVIVFS